MLFTEYVPWFLVYDGEGDTGASTEGTGTGTEGDPSPPNPDDDKPTLSQKKVNAIMAEEKRKHKIVIDGQVKELETLRKSKNLSEQEKTTLTSRIEELQNSVLSKEQLAQKEKQKLETEYKTKLDTVSTESNFWKSLFHKETITRSIVDEASKSEAFSPTQIVSLLKDNTRLSEVLDGEGNPIPGQYITKVKFQDTDKEGKPVTLDLTIPEVMKRMKDRPEEYGNLFKSGVSSGLGQSGGHNKSGKDPSKMSPEEYRKWRNDRMGRKDK